MHSGTIALTAGVKVNIVMEHRERTGEAVSRLEWESASQPRQVVPREQLFSTWTLNVNFQPAGAPVPAGYVADTGTDRDRERDRRPLDHHQRGGRLQ